MRLRVPPVVTRSTRTAADARVSARARPRRSRCGPGWVLLLVALVEGSASAQPVTRERHAAVYDSLGARMLVFGGYANNQLTDEVWSLALHGTPAWSRLLPSGAGPSPRLGHSLTLDPVRHRFIVVGGLDAGGTPDDVWALSLDGAPSWTPLTPTGGPPTPPTYHSAIYDPIGDRIIVYGGSTGPGFPSGDLWSLWLSPSPSWEQMLPVNAGPIDRQNHSAVYDPARRRMIVFAGGTPARLNDVWSLSLSGTLAWTQLTTKGTPPAPRMGHAALLDAATDAMYVFGGDDGNQPLNDAWKLSLSGDPTWSELAPSGERPTPRGFHTVVGDLEQHRLLAFGGFPNPLEPTWALDLPDGLEWSPFRPALRASATPLQFPVVTLGDTVSTGFRIRNAGMLPLHVNGFEPPDASIRVADPAPFDLASGEERTGLLVLAAVAAGVRNDSFAVLSNDPLAGRHAFAFHADVRALNFATHVLGDPAEVPLGASFIVAVTPDPDVHIERAMLHYRVALAGAPYDSVGFVALSSDLVAAVPASVVSEVGVEYWVQAQNSAFATTVPADAPLGTRHQSVASPTAITLTPRPLTGTELVAGREIAVELTLPAGAAMDTGELHYRAGGREEFAVVPFVPDALGRPTAMIPDTAVGASGIEYWADVHTRTAALRSPALPLLATGLRVRVPDLLEPREHPGNRYRILSIPLDFGTEFSGGIDGLLTDQLGTYDRTHWRAFAYDPLAPGYVELATPADDRFDPLPGRAFWLVTRGAHRIDTSPVIARSTDTSHEYAVPLTPGWNLVGNPFDFPVRWADVRRDTDVTADPVAFDPSLGPSGGYAAGSPATLEPFEGYFIHTTAPDTLWVPPHSTAAPGVAQPADGSTAGAAAEWAVSLEASTERALEAANVLGVAPGATASWDRRDRRKPPAPPGAWVQAGFVSTRGEPGLFTRDLRPADPRGDSWELEVRSSTPGEVIELRLCDCEGAHAHPGLRVFDREQGIVVGDLPATGAAPRAVTGVDAVALPGLRHRIVSFGTRPYRISIAAGPTEYLDSVALGSLGRPTRLTLDAVAPNPIRRAARIRFGLARSEAVELEIFDTAGRRIWTTPLGSAMPAGYHSVVWDGRSSDGARARPGIYLLRIASSSASCTTRIVVLD